MRLLLDECVPRPLKRDLVAHDVWHVVDMGWSSKHNGELLQLMVAEGFDALLTVDQNLDFQQNLRAAGSPRKTHSTPALPAVRYRYRITPCKVRQIGHAARTYS
jgi:hypothetical protein